MHGNSIQRANHYTTALPLSLAVDRFLKNTRDFRFMNFTNFMNFFYIFIYYLFIYLFIFILPMTFTHTHDLYPLPTTFSYTQLNNRNHSGNCQRLSVKNKTEHVRHFASVRALSCYGQKTDMDFKTILRNSLLVFGDSAGYSQYICPGMLS